jgi:hypothetical protein
VKVPLELLLRCPLILVVVGPPQREKERAMTLNLQRAASELAEKIAALPARYPYIGAAEKNVYLFTPTEGERDLIVQALYVFAAASPPNGSS